MSSILFWKEVHIHFQLWISTYTLVFGRIVKVFLEHVYMIIFQNLQHFIKWHGCLMYTIFIVALMVSLVNLIYMFTRWNLWPHLLGLEDTQINNFKMVFNLNKNDTMTSFSSYTFFQQKVHAVIWSSILCGNHIFDMHSMFFIVVILKFDLGLKGLQSHLRYNTWSGLGKCFEIRTHFQKCGRTNLNILKWFSLGVLNLWDKNIDYKWCPNWIIFRPLEESWSANIKNWFTLFIWRFEGQIMPKRVVGNQSLFVIVKS
jgi:hypothetical protein